MSSAGRCYTPHFFPLLFSTNEFCAHIAISQNVKNEDEKSLREGKQQKMYDRGKHHNSFPKTTHGHSYPSSMQDVYHMNLV